MVGVALALAAATLVAVSVFETADLVELTVDDNGVEIPEADRVRVPERFVRLDAARARDAGAAASTRCSTGDDPETLTGDRLAVLTALQAEEIAVTIADLDCQEQFTDEIIRQVETEVFGRPVSG